MIPIYEALTAVALCAAPVMAVAFWLDGLHARRVARANAERRTLHRSTWLRP